MIYFKSHCNTSKSLIHVDHVHSHYVALKATYFTVKKDLNRKEVEEKVIILLACCSNLSHDGNIDGMLMINNQIYQMTQIYISIDLTPSCAGKKSHKTK